MPPLMQLPAYQYPQNGGIDFKPLGDAIDSYGQNALARRKLDQGDRKLDMAGSHLSMAQATHAEEMKQRKVDEMAHGARVLGEMADSPQKTALLADYWAKHGDVAAHMKENGIDTNHPEALKFIHAQSRIYDPVGEKLKLAQIHSAYRKDEPDIVRTLIAAGINPKSARGQELIAQSIKGNSPIDQVIVDAIKRASEPPSAPQSPVRPQSFNDPQQGGTPLQPIADTPSPPQPSNALAAGRTPQSPGPSPNALAPGGNDDPMLIPAQMAQGPPPTAAPPAPPALVDTPLGPMPAAKAKLLGFGLAYQGKGEAGKMMIPTEGKVGKEGGNEIDKQMIARIGDLSELDNIKRQFKPEYLEIGGLLKAKGLSWQAFAGGDMHPDDKAYLTEFARFRAASTERLNNRIKALAGTAVSGAEEKRMLSANPSAGTGILDGQDPVTFQAAVDEQIYLQKMALARFNYLKTKGLEPTQISELSKSGRIEGLAGLDDMRDIMARRADGLLLEKQKAGIPADRIKNDVRQQMKQEFGI